MMQDFVQAAAATAVSSFIVFRAKGQADSRSVERRLDVDRKGERS
jgi:hypothetical protein